MNAFHQGPIHSPIFLPRVDDKLMNLRYFFALGYSVLMDNLALPLCLFTLPFFPRYKLLNKALLANWLSSLDDASLTRTASFQTPFSLSLSKFSWKPLRFLDFSLFLFHPYFIKNTVLQVPSFSVYRLHVINLIIVVSISAGNSNYSASAFLSQA